MMLGSLFSGSGGFELAGVLNGITPIWSSEIEAFPLKVTAARFPKVKQLGDVTKIDGAAIEPVDIITFGSPCQDLSVAGKQAGIHEGQRSNLFFEAVRIIREMREHDENNGRTDKHVRPRFAVWENVPGAFSSNKGADFKAVLDALCQVRDPGADVPQPKRWGGAGCVVGDGYSVAWRVYDAQYWGVPQRRKRIYLVADFGSERAGEILFEREGVRGDSAESGAAREGAAEDAERGAGGSGGVRCLNPWDAQSKRQFDVNGAYHTLQAYSGVAEQTESVTQPLKILGRGVLAAGFKGCAGAKSGSTGFGIGVSPMLTAQLQTHTVYALQGNGIDCADTAGCNGAGWRTNEMYTLNTIDRPAVAYGVDCRNATLDKEKTHTIQAGISLNCTPSVLYDARGNGGGMIAPTITGDHNGHISDYTCVCVERTHDE